MPDGYESKEQLEQRAKFAEADQGKSKLRPAAKAARVNAGA
jgi:hypothetical protein